MARKPCIVIRSGQMSTPQRPGGVRRWAPEPKTDSKTALIEGDLWGD